MWKFSVWYDTENVQYGCILDSLRIETQARRELPKSVCNCRIHFTWDWNFRFSFDRYLWMLTFRKGICKMNIQNQVLIVPVQNKIYANQHSNSCLTPLVWAHAMTDPACHILPLGLNSHTGLLSFPETQPDLFLLKAFAMAVSPGQPWLPCSSRRLAILYPLWSYLPVPQDLSDLMYTPPADSLSNSLL